MSDYAKEPQPEAPTPPPLHGIALVDGDTTTPLSAEALIVALFACGFVLVRDPVGKILDVRLDRDKVVALALKAQGVLDAGEPIKLETNRVMRPTNGGGLVQP